MNKYEIVFSHPQITDTSAVNIALKHIFGGNSTVEWINEHTVVIKSDNVEEINDLNRLKCIQLKEELMEYSCVNHSSKEQHLTNEYIQEAENQDGLDYWKNFDNFNALLDDVELYINAHH